MAKKALLMILDGWGIGKHGKGDVIASYIRTLLRLTALARTVLSLRILR